MQMSRRGFLGSMMAAAVAPAVVKAESLMKIVQPKIVAPRGVTRSIFVVDELPFYSIDEYKWCEPVSNPNMIHGLRPGDMVTIHSREHDPTFSVDHAFGSKRESIYRIVRDGRDMPLSEVDTYAYPRDLYPEESFDFSDIQIKRVDVTQELGEKIADQLYLTANREGFMRRYMRLAEAEKRQAEKVRSVAASRVEAPRVLGKPITVRWEALGF